MTTVDRTHRLYTDEFGECNPNRIHVMRSRLTSDWIVWRGNKALHRAPTHTEAIRWAQSRADLDDLARRVARHALTIGTGGEKFADRLRALVRATGITFLDEPSENPFPEPMEAP